MDERMLSGRTAVYMVSFAAMVYLSLIILGDLGSLMRISVPLPVLFVFLSLVMLGYTLRTLRWHLYSRKLGADIKLSKNFMVFLSGLSMTLTPARMGEAIKCYVLKRISGVPISRTLPAVLVERLTDIVSLCMLALSGIFIKSFYALLAGAFCFFVLLILFAMRFSSAYRFLSKLPVIRRFVSQIAGIREGGVRVSNMRMVAVSVAIAVPAWLMECLGLWLVLSALGLDAPIETAIFIFSFSSVFGAVSMLPGGLGAAEGSMTVLLVELLPISLTTAVWVTIVTRLCTMWFGTGIGAASLLATERLKRERH